MIESHQEYFEKEFIRLRDPSKSKSMIFTGWDNKSNTCTFIDYNGDSRHCSEHFVLGYLEGIECIRRELGDD